MGVEDWSGTMSHFISNRTNVCKAYVSEVWGLRPFPMLFAVYHGLELAYGDGRASCEKQPPES